MVHAAVRAGQAGRHGGARDGSGGAALTWRRRRGGCGCCSPALSPSAWPGVRLSSFTAVRYSSAASSVVAVREQLSLDAQQIYSHLSDANDAAATAFLAPAARAGGHQGRATSADIAAGEAAASRARPPRAAGTGAAAQRPGPAGSRTAHLHPGDRATPRRTTGSGLPVGAAYLREASGLMHDTLLHERQGPVRGREREPERRKRPGHRAAARHRHAGRRPRRRLPAVPGVALAARPHQPGAQRRPGRRRRAAGVRLADLAGRRLHSGPGATCSARRPAGSATVEAVAKVEHRGAGGARRREPRR